MIFRPATEADLPALKLMYREIIGQMEADGIRIWDDVYPTEVLIDDIRASELYMAEQNGAPACAFALCRSTGGIDTMHWQTPLASARYIERLGVSPRHLRRGLGEACLREAMRIAHKDGAAFLRLFVVDKNTPAIDLYYKIGMTRVDGRYDKYIFGDFLISEYGFEIQTKCGSEIKREKR